MVDRPQVTNREGIRSNFHGMLDGSMALPMSISHHIRIRHLELAAQLTGRTPVYLDSRFWFDIRRADEDEPAGAHAVPLLRALRDAMRGGKIFCPISASTFIELLKHSNSDVRIRSAQLVDELSLGIAVVDPERLAEAELEWLASNHRDSAVDPCVVPIWTKVSYSLGILVPDNRIIPRDTMLALQVATFDEVWNKSLTEFAAANPRLPDFGSAEVASRLNEGSLAHAHEVTDFETVFRSEVAGIADLHGQMFLDVAKRMAQSAGNKIIEPTQNDLRLHTNFLADVLRLRKARQALRSFHIRSSLYAIIRNNKARRFKPNDLLDIEYAVAGVGYCRAFFSERTLVTSLKQKPLGLDSLYDCLITSDFKQAVEFVSKL